MYIGTRKGWLGHRWSLSSPPQSTGSWSLPRDAVNHYEQDSLNSAPQPSIFNKRIEEGKKRERRKIAQSIRSVLAPFEAACYVALPPQILFWGAFFLLL
jgi:hypothetical protein